MMIHFHRRLPRCIIAILLWLAGAVYAVPAHASPLLFLNPDANHDVILDVMKDFDELFEKKRMAMHFQPIQSETAARALGHVSYGIIASAYEQVWKNLDLQPVLVPEADGNTYFQKTLVAETDVAKNRAGLIVAAAVPQERIEDVKAVLRKHGYSGEPLYILAVAKDIDAMLAVTFGEAHAALVTSESVATLRQVNPTASAQLRTLMKTEPVMRAPLCRQKGMTKAQEETMLQFFLHLPDTQEGRQILELMSVTRWVPYAQELK